MLLILLFSNMPADLVFLTRVDGISFHNWELFQSKSVVKLIILILPECKLPQIRSGKKYSYLI